MTNQIMNPAYVIRSYVWELLKQNMGMSESHYGGLVPIVPVAEEPEISEFSKPHIVYGYALENSGDRAFAGRGSITFAVYDTDFENLTEILNVIGAAFERDESANEVNAYSTAKGFTGIRFGFIRVNFVEGGTPEETEGGRQSALISLGFEYYVDYAIKTYTLLPNGLSYGWV